MKISHRPWSYHVLFLEMLSQFNANHKSAKFDLLHVIMPIYVCVTCS